jgi:hypothetical protein
MFHYSNRRQFIPVRILIIHLIESPTVLSLPERALTSFNLELKLSDVLNPGAMWYPITGADVIAKYTDSIAKHEGQTSYSGWFLFAIVETFSNL